MRNNLQQNQLSVSKMNYDALLHINISYWKLVNCN